MLRRFFPNCGEKRACRVKTLARIPQLNFAGAWHERRICRFGRLGARCRFLAVDSLSATISGQKRMEGGFVCRLDARGACALHWGKGLSPRRRRAAAARLPLDL